MHKSKNIFFAAIVLAVFTVVLAFQGPSVSAQVESVDLSVGNVENGKEIYNRVCIACHGDSAQGNELLNSPRLAGQEPWYIARQIKNFMLGIRGSDSRDIYGMQMRPMALTLKNDQEVADLVAYIGTFSSEPAKEQ